MLKGLSYYLLLLRFGLTECNEEVITNYGTLSGKTELVLEKEVAIFLGVPYAKPPVDDLRFRPPEPIEPWSKTLDATSLSPACIQPTDTSFPGFWGSEMWNPNTPQSEDCLYMNIWYPKGIKNATVMVWIFGGGFYSGSPSLNVYDGRGLAAQGDVIVININYRVAALGFLYLGMSECPGNMGLLDQQMALRWIKENVHHFGGNPDQISIFGESAGAASVSAHMVAHGSRDLFNYAIMQSGSILDPWAMDTPERAINKSIAFATVVKCNNDDSAEMIQCLMDLPSDSFTTQIWESDFDWHFLEMPMPAVSKDEHFFSEKDAFEAIREGDIKKTNIIVGANQNEGTFWMTYYLADYFGKDSTGMADRSAYLDSIETVLDRELPFVRNAAKFEYDTDQTCGAGNRTSFGYTYAVDEVIGDYIFTCDSLSFADKVTEVGGNSFAYFMPALISSNPWPEWMGMMHGYEIEYVFGVPLVNETHTEGSYTPEEKQLSKEIIGYWTSFAATGIPEYSDSETIWEPYESRDKTYMKLNTEGSKLSKGFKQSQCGFWNDIKNLRRESADCRENNLTTQKGKERK